MVGTGMLIEGDELLAELAEFSDAVVDLVDLTSQHLPHVGAGLFAAVPQRQDLADLVEGDPEALGGLDEGQRLDGTLVVLPVARARAVRLGQQSDVLVVADGLRVQPELVRQLSDPHHAPSRASSQLE